MNRVYFVTIAGETLKVDKTIYNIITNLQSQLEQKEKKQNEIKEYVMDSCENYYVNEPHYRDLIPADDILSIIERNNSNE